MSGKSFGHSHDHKQKLKQVPVYFSDQGRNVWKRLGHSREIGNEPEKVLFILATNEEMSGQGLGIRATKEMRTKKAPVYCSDQGRNLRERLGHLREQGNEVEKDPVNFSDQ